MAYELALVRTVTITTEKDRWLGTTLPNSEAPALKIEHVAANPNGEQEELFKDNPFFIGVFQRNGYRIAVSRSDGTDEIVSSVLTIENIITHSPQHIAVEIIKTIIRDTYFRYLCMNRWFTYKDELMKLSFNSLDLSSVNFFWLAQNIFNYVKSQESK